MNGVSMVSWVLVSHRPLKADYYFRANGIKKCIAIRYQNGILVSDIFKYSIFNSWYCNLFLVFWCNKYRKQRFRLAWRGQWPQKSIKSFEQTLCDVNFKVGIAEDDFSLKRCYLKEFYFRNSHQGIIYEILNNIPFLFSLHLCTVLILPVPIPDEEIKLT